MGGSWAEALRRDPDPATPAEPVSKTAKPQNGERAPVGGNDQPQNAYAGAPEVASKVGTGASEDLGDNLRRKEGGQLKTLVVDTNAIITGTRLDNVAESLVTITEVFEEIRDKQTRHLMATLPYEIKTREPSDASLKEVVRFARATGDLHSLSAPDIKLIALTYTLEAELYGTAHIRREPPPIAVAKKSQARMKDPPGWGRVPNPADWAGIDEVGDDGKRPGSSSGHKGGSRILGVKALDLETASVASSSGAVSTEEAPQGSEKALAEGSGPAPGRLDKAPGGLAEGLEVGRPAEQTENESSTGISAGVSEELGISEEVQEAEKDKASSAKSAPAWGGFTMAPPVVTPSPSNSLRAVEVMSGEAPGTSENANPLLEAPQSTAQRGFPPQRRGGGRGGGRGRGRQSRAAVPTKPVVVDGVHAVLVEEQAIEHAEGGDGWEKNVSRSTRRKHQRRAYRGAESAAPGEAEAAPRGKAGSDPLGEAEGGSGDPRSGLGTGGDENAGGDETGGQCIGAGGQLMNALEALQIGGQNEVSKQGGKGAGENAAGGASSGVNEGGPGEFRGDKKAPEGMEAATISNSESMSSDVGGEKGDGAEMQQSRKSSAVQGPSVAMSNLGGQFSDAEEESDEADAIEINAAEDAASDSVSEEPETEEYEYVHQSKDEALETASVAPSEPGTASEAGWDRASSTVLGRDSEVACMTSDFAMQNVILQMGLRLLSVDGLGITQVHRWALRCQACGQVTHEMGRIFCPKCGNGGTLNKVTIMVGEDGALVAGVRKRFSLRGTRYPIPLPKGGRDGKQSDPILREDQLPSRIRHGMGPRKKKGDSVDVFGAEYGPETWFQAVPMKGVSHNAVHVKNAAAAFNSRKNPNERRVARKK